MEVPSGQMRGVRVRIREQLREQVRVRVQRWLLGAAQTLAVVAAFVGLGLAAALAEQARGAAPYTAQGRSPGVEEETRTPDGTLWLVDAYNVLNVALLGGADRSGWWRRDARSLLLEHVSRFDAPDAEIWLVFDGSTPPEQAPADPRLHTVFAPSADDWLLRRVRELAPTRSAVLVTADRRLAARARHRGAQVVPPHVFLRRCAPRVAAAPQHPGKAPERP